MNGAHEFASLFSTGQYGRFYLVSGKHARGLTFHIYLLPAGEAAEPNGRNNPPLNKNAVEVFGVTSGNCGWNEEYGWLHQGPWQQDFERLVAEVRDALTEDEKNSAQRKAAADSEEKNRIAALLAAY